ncbi:MAG: 16S rRNA pseudouridine(516) synthase [Proteobacteria bacterium]|nr:MAG: 16S rRNA pseudouridine(516) synthase [Pseudomonadota bacterium]
MRLDKLLSSASNLTRSQAVKAIKQGDVLVDGKPAMKGSDKVTEDNEVRYIGVLIKEPKPRYYMLNKPSGCVSANRDKNALTVFDYLLVPRREQLHLAGRLDRDTTGLILATDDGQWSHRLTSPRHGHFKRYRVGLAEPITDKAVMMLEQGVTLEGESKPTKPAIVNVLEPQLILLSISEGRHHQVKRMLLAVGNEVVTLHREAVAHIELDKSLSPGEYRALTSEEIDLSKP